MTATVTQGDCIAVLEARNGPLFDAVICDPPYHLSSIVKRFGKADSAPCKEGATGAYARAAKGFMGKEWDGGDVAFRPETWRAIYDQMKPGAHLVAFSGTRTVHRMVCAIEDAGFEIRDMLAWMYGSGFAKSHNLNRRPICSCKDGEYPLPKDHDKPETEHSLRLVPSADLSASEHNEVERGQVLQPRLQEQGSSAFRAEGAKSEAGGREQSGVGGRKLHRAGEGLQDDLDARPSEGAQERLCSGAHSSRGENAGPPLVKGRGSASLRSRPSEQRSEELESLREPHRTLDGASQTGCGQCPDCGKLKPTFEGFGSALKPAFEPICLARKPLSEKSIAANVLKWGTGAINIDGCRVEGGERPLRITTGDLACGNTWNAKGGGGSRAAGTFELGRWPANALHDNSDEVLAGFPERDGGGALTGHEPSQPLGGTVFGDGMGRMAKPAMCDSGSAARFFYSAKAGPLDRIGSAHPTVKPVDVMRWLVRLVTPPGGLILDPFAGSGTTGIAAMAEGFDCELIDLMPDHVADIERKLAFLRGEGKLTVQEHLNGREKHAPALPMLDWLAA